MGQNAEELRRDIEATRAELSGTLEAIGDRVSPGRIVQRRKNRMVEGVTSIRERVMGTASDAKGRITDTTYTARDAVTGSAGHAVDSVRDAPDAMMHKAEGNPMMAGAIAFGAGLLIAAMIPPTEVEKSASVSLMDKMEPVKEGLTNVAHEVAGNLKEPAMDAAQTVKDAATESAQTVSATAKQAVDDTKQQAATSAEAVKSAAPTTS